MKLRVLIVAEVREGWSFVACGEALTALGHEVQMFNMGEVTFPMGRSMFWRAVRKISTLPLVRRINRALFLFLEKTRFRPDIILFCKGEYILPETLLRLRRETGALLFNWQTDDYFSLRLSSVHAIRSIPLYDAIFAHTPSNVEELRRRGARFAEYLPHGADPVLYHPLGEAPEGEYDADLIFIGNWRKERQRFLEEFAAGGLPFRFVLWGSQWERLPPRSPLRRYAKFAQIPWKKYGGAFRRTKITLVFLVRFDTGRVQVPLRLFEVPAAGGFMLVEKDRGQAEEFFRDKEEMVQFDDVSDLRAQIDYYLRNDAERHRIARAAQKRMVEGGYFYSDKMERVMEVSRTLREQGRHG